MNFLYGGIAGSIIAISIVHVLFPKEKSESALLLGFCVGTVIWQNNEFIFIRDTSILILLKFILPLACFELGVSLFSGKYSRLIISTFRPLLFVFACMLFGWM